LRQQKQHDVMLVNLPPQEEQCVVKRPDNLCIFQRTSHRGPVNGSQYIEVGVGISTTRILVCTVKKAVNKNEQMNERD
jgi:hypothetical protein